MATQTRIASCLRAFALALVLAGGLPSALAAGPVAPPLLLAEVLRGDVALEDYWVSEKLDGARALWDGQSLRFRSGRTVPAPAWFVAALPSEPLDGELWLGRGRFAELSGIVRRQQPRDDEWRQVRFMVFEQPDGAGSFTERVERLKAIVARAGVPWLQVVEQFRVADRAALQARLDAVVAAGGEGLMLHRADAPYLTGRSDAPRLTRACCSANASASISTRAPVSHSTVMVRARMLTSTTRPLPTALVSRAPTLGRPCRISA